MGRRYSRYRRYQFCSWDREERNAFLVLWELDMRPSNLGKTYEIHCYSRTSSTSYHDSYHASADLVFSSPSQIQHLPDLHDSDLNHIAENGRHTKLDFCTQSSRRPEVPYWRISGVDCIRHCSRCQDSMMKASTFPSLFSWKSNVARER